MEESKAIMPFDWQRMLLGEQPLGFLLEIGFRSMVMYIVLLLLLRMLSKRALTQLSILEFAIVIALGSAAGDPAFYEDVPLLHGILVLAVVVTLQMLYTWYLRKSQRFERVMEGKPVELISEGCIQAGALEKARLAQDELFELLRREQVQQLGEIRRAYLEENGQLSVFLEPTPRPGLAFVPPWKLQPPREYRTGQKLERSLLLACMCCGCPCRLEGELPVCRRCGGQSYTLARLDPLGIGTATSDKGEMDSPVPGKQ